jgi:hypothetical protein
VSTIDTLSRALPRIRLLKFIPEDVDPEQLEKIRSGALDVSTAILGYLTCAITNITNRLSSGRHVYRMLIR